MPVKKLYRQTMAEIAGITPVQLDYLVRIGAVAPDKGNTRKYYSYKEATFVLLSAQLVSVFSDQRLIVEVIHRLRSYLNIPGCSSGRIADYKKASDLAELAQTEGEHIERHIEGWAASLFVLEKGYRYRDPRKSKRFMEVFCAKNDLDFDRQIAEFAQKVRNAACRPQYHGHLNLHDFIMREQYMRSVFGVPTYVHIAKNADGSVEALVEPDTGGFSERISWTIINCGKLFPRLLPYADAEFAGVVDDYLEKYDDGADYGRAAERRSEAPRRAGGAE